MWVLDISTDCKRNLVSPAPPLTVIPYVQQDTNTLEKCEQLISDLPHCSGSYSEGRHLDGCDILPGGVKTHGNVCISQGTKAPGSEQTPRGDTIFVRTDCGNRKPLPMDQQDPAYNHPGVPLPRDEYEAFAATLDDGIEALSGTSDITCETDDSSPFADDCTAAMGIYFSQFVTAIVQTKEEGELSWGPHHRSCAIRLEYEKDSADDCKVTMAEILKAATGIQNQCQKGDRVGGVRQLRKDGKCDALLRIAATDGRPVQLGSAAPFSGLRQQDRRSVT